MQVVIFDWDETLVYCYTTMLYAGSEGLLKKLISKGIKVYILTGRDREDPRNQIQSVLAKKGINLDEANIMWVGEIRYQGHEVTGNAKARAIEKLQESQKFDKNEILFVDDRKEYVDSVKEKGFK